MQEIRDRQDIAEEYQWNLASMFATDADWELELASVQSAFESDPFADIRGRLAEGPGHALAYFRQSIDLQLRVEKLYIYAHTKSDQDTRNTLYQGMHSRAHTLLAAYSEMVSFFEPELLAVDAETLASYLDHPDLSEFRHALEDIMRWKPHVLSAETEAALAALHDPLAGVSQAYSQLTNADFVHGSFTVDDVEYVVTNGRYGLLLEHRDRRVRQKAYELLMDTYVAHRNVLAALYTASVKKDITVARLRSFASARDAALFHYNIPTEVYDALVEGVHSQIEHVLHYMEVRRKALGLERVAPWDRYVSLVESADTRYTFEEAMDLIKEGLRPLGDEYVSILDRAVKERWIDVFENEGKRSGAYSTGTYNTLPFILMSFQGNYDSVSTLAHELGHSVHSHLSHGAQPPQYAGYSIFLAEIASTVNETLLLRHLLATAQDAGLRARLINEQLDKLSSTIIRQTQFAEFEAETHQLAERGEALTPDSLADLFAGLSTYYAGEAAQDDERTKYGWSRIPHFYHAFYVYQYATGLSAALAFVDQILTEGEPAAKRYLDFLRSGSRADPLAILKDAGVDMTDPAVVGRALKLFGELVDELENALIH